MTAMDVENINNIILAIKINILKCIGHRNLNSGILSSRLFPSLALDTASGHESLYPPSM